MVNVSALLFVREAQRTDDGGLNLLGAVWDTINIQGDPSEGGVQLAVLMQSDDPAESNDISIEVKAWREDVAAPTINKITYALDPSVIGRNRTSVVIVPGAFFIEPGNYVITAAQLDEAPSAFVRVAVVEVATDESAEQPEQPEQLDEIAADETQLDDATADAADAVDEVKADEVEADEAETDEADSESPAEAEGEGERSPKRRVFARSRG
jgi:hypothetical protein